MQGAIMDEDIIKHNPMLKEPILTVLALAEEAGDRATLEAMALQAWKPFFSQAPAAAIDTLVRHGFIAQQSYVNGEPYEGTLEDMQLDESVPDDAVAEVRLAVTEAGRSLASSYDPASTLAALFGERPRYADVFSAILSACAADDGATREAIEAIVEAAAPTAADGKKVYPQYFLDALECAGGIAWDGAWRTTDAGRAALAPQS